MEFDYESASNKEREINESLRTSLISMGLEPSITDDYITSTLNASISVKPPRKLVSVAETATTSGAEPEKIHKPGNVKLNITALVDQIIKTSPVGAIITPEPWLAMFAFIEALRQSSKLKDVRLTETDAMVIWTMWFVRNRRSNTVSGEDLLTKLNTHILKYERSSLTQGDVDASLKNLEKISTIRPSKNAPDCWYLVGWVKRSYS